MGFNRDNNGGGRGDYDNRSYGGGSDRQDRETFKATCASCGKECDLPFKPTGARPVYCRDCFKKNSPQDSGGRNDRNDRSRDSRRGFNDRQMFNAVCDNCGDKCQLPFMPREGKEVLCSKCFEEKGGDPRKNNGQSAQQIAELNAKLDRILELLGEKPAVKAEAKPKAAKPVEVEETPVETKEEKPEIELSADNTVEMEEIVIEEKAKKKTSKKSE